MKIRKYFRFFLMNIFAITFGVMLMLCIVCVSALYRNLQNSTDTFLYKEEMDYISKLMQQSEMVFERLSTAAYSFYNVDFPTLLNPNQKSQMGAQMIEFQRFSNQYITNIQWNVGNWSISPTEISHDVYLGKIKLFHLYIEEDISWPYCFDMVSVRVPAYDSVVFTISAYQLSKQIFLTESKERMDYLVNEEGVILLSNNRGAYFQRIEEIYPGIFSDTSSDSSESFTTYGDYYVTTSEINKYGFRILSMVHTDYYNNHYEAMHLYVLGMCGILCGLALLLSVFLAFRFYRPINEMVHLLQVYTHEDLAEYKNEITFIRQSLSEFANRKEKIQDQLSVTLRELQDNQAVVLQNQINSHFLFNTMENIKAISIVELGMDNDVENAIMLLNSIIREGVYQKTTFVFLDRELYLARCYLELMQLRFPEVKTRWYIDETLQRYRVLKLLMQPVLENCFSHAFREGCEREALIQISVFKKDNCLMIRIRDNGHGMDEKALKQIQQRLASPDGMGGTSDSSSHVGIWNVNKRIQNAFGSQYGLTVIGTPPGITVEICHPLLLN